MTGPRLYAHLDLLSPTRLMGWCKTDQIPAQQLELRITAAQKTIRATPNVNRKDVKDVHGGDMRCGFDIRLPNFSTKDLGQAKITLRDTQSGADVPVEFARALNKQHANPPSYQSFEPGTGSSQSEKKLQALDLPDLAGKSFLDIGCNAGFFCKYALDQGATRVVGIEADRDAAQQARINAPEAEILNQRWDRLPDKQFDVIIMLSALHYEKDPKTFLQRIRQRLTPDGVFVLEGGIAQSEFAMWKTVHRNVGAVKFPSVKLLQNHLFEGFAYRYIGPSVNQPGDPLQRHVYHACRKSAVWTIVRGASRTGKSTLTASLIRNGIGCMRLDQILTEQRMQPIATGNELFDNYMTRYHRLSVGSWVDGIEDPKLAHAVARHLVETIPTECDTTMDGYIMSNDLVFDAFITLAKTKGVRVWVTDRHV